MPRYRTRSLEFLADQWFPGKEIPGVKHVPESEGVAESWHLELRHGGRVSLLPGDWVLRDPDDTRVDAWPDAVFRAAFEPVPDHPILNACLG